MFVAAVALLLYGRAAGFDFVHADDADLIVGNQAFLADLHNAPRAFERSYFEVQGDLTGQKTYYRPVAIVSFMVDAALGGAAPRAYHATNVALHAAACCLLLALAAAWGATMPAALAAALIFAVHPVNAQAVAWVAGRNDLLLAVFGLCSLLAWSRAPALHPLAFGLALFSKETGLCFPAIAVMHQRLVHGERPARAQRIALACDAAIVLAWMALRSRALAGMPSEMSTAALRTAVMNVPQLLVQLGKMLVPVRLSVSPGVDGPGILLGAVAIALLTATAWRYVSRRHAILALAWVLLFLLPTLMVPGLPAYEHRAYVPLIGLLVCFAAGVVQPTAHTWRYAAAVAVALLATITARRMDVYADAASYWSDAARDVQFAPMAHVNLGQLHEAAGRPADARREYLRALELDPATPKAHNNLGVVLMSLDEPDLALSHFQEEASRHPWNADAWFNLGLWMEQRGDRAAAKKYYERAIAANKAYRPAYDKLGLSPEP